MAIEQIPELGHEQRIEAFQQAVNQVRTACHLLADYEIWAALDETKRCLFHLDRQLTALKEMPAGSDLLSENLQLQRKRNGRHKGVDVIPGRIKQAREEAGMTLGQIAGRDVTRAAISLIENGHTRPSRLTLELISRRTGKPIEYFTGVPT